MKRKVQVGSIIASAILFIVIFVYQVVRVVKMFENPESFSFAPIVIGVTILIVLLGHIGLYVLIMDRVERNHIITDEDEWWKKWDMV